MYFSSLLRSIPARCLAWAAAASLLGLAAANAEDGAAGLRPAQAVLSPDQPIAAPAEAALPDAIGPEADSLRASPPLGRLLEWAALHPEDAQAFWDKWGEEIWSESQPQVRAAAADAWLIWALATAILLTPAAHLVTKIMVPYRATWGRSAFLGGTQVAIVLLFIGAANALGNQVPLAATMTAVQGVVLVGMSIRMLNAGLPQAAAFAVVTSAGASLAGAAAVAGGFAALPEESRWAPFAGYADAVIAQSVTPRLQAEIDEYRQARTSQQRLFAQRQAEYAEHQARTRAHELDLKAAEDEIAAIKASDAYRYARLGSQRDKARPQDAIEAYRAFLQDRPESEYAVHAQAEIDLLQDNLAHAKLAAERERRGFASLESFRKDLLAGKLGLNDLRKALLSRRRSEVQEILGAPDALATNVYIYEIPVLDEVSQDSKPFLVRFEIGEVIGVDFVDRYMHNLRTIPMPRSPAAAEAKAVNQVGGCGVPVSFGRGCGGGGCGR